MALRVERWCYYYDYDNRIAIDPDEVLDEIADVKQCVMQYLVANVNEHVTINSTHDLDKELNIPHEYIGDDEEIVYRYVIHFTDLEQFINKKTLNSAIADHAGQLMTGKLPEPIKIRRANTEYENYI